ncbi:MAG: hypothetical protein ACTHNU_00165 [Gaiellales bacterium]
MIRSIHRRRVALAALAAVASVASVATAAYALNASSPRPPLLIGGGFLPSPTSRDAYLVNMTIAPSSGDLTGPVWVTACNRAVCHRAQGGGSLPIVNVPFRTGHHPAAGTHATVDVAACSAGFRCVTVQFSGVVPAR